MLCVSANRFSSPGYVSSENALHSPVSGVAPRSFVLAVGGVPSHVGYPAWMNAAPKEQGGARVPESVPAERGETRMAHIESRGEVERSARLARQCFAWLRGFEKPKRSGSS